MFESRIMGIIPLPIFKLNFGVRGERSVCVLISWKQILHLNNFPQGLMDVIQILDFHHFKL